MHSRWKWKGQECSLKFASEEETICNEFLVLQWICAFIVAPIHCYQFKARLFHRSASWWTAAGQYDPSHGGGLWKYGAAVGDRKWVLLRLLPRRHYRSSQLPGIRTTCAPDLQKEILHSCIHCYKMSFYSTTKERETYKWKYSRKRERCLVKGFENRVLKSVFTWQSSILVFSLGVEVHLQVSFNSLIIMYKSN